MDKYVTFTYLKHILTTDNIEYIKLIFVFIIFGDGDQYYFITTTIVNTNFILLLMDTNVITQIFFKSKYLSPAG